ncbi:MAG: hypothetical protein IJV84_00020 [Bacteroidales bacterium]|nr:hypothetical protein [Bacteroidales bacterium]
MKRYITLSICTMIMSVTSLAANNNCLPEYFRRCLYVSVDFAPGTVFNGRRGNNESNSSYGTDIAIGYRFLPQFAFALGTGAHSYSNKTLTCDDTVRRKVENTCIPLFIRLHSDFFDEEVTPYVQMDLGYSFIEMYTREDAGRVKFSQDRFTNGRYEYIEMDDSYIQYGNAGWFTALDLGMSLHVVGRCRMNLGLSAGVHQASLGTSFLTAEGEVINFGRTDYLYDGSGGSSTIVRTAGLPDFRDSLEPSLKVKMGFTF